VDSEVLSCPGPLDLLAGESIMATVSATTSAEACATYPNTAAGNADNHDEVTDDATITCQGPNLEIVKTAENESINAGETARFTITLTNNGPGTAVNATINDPLPAGLDWSLDSYSPDPAAACAITGAVGSEELDCGPLTLASGASITATVSATTSLVACSTYPNTAAGDADNHDEVTDDATITCQIPVLSIVKTAENEFINAGDVARFTVTLTNNGPGTAVNATINDPLPAGLDWSLDSSSPAGANCAISGAVGSEVLSCPGPLDLAVGETIMATVSATTSTEACTTYPNTATGDADNADQVTDDALITCTIPLEPETAWASNTATCDGTLAFNTNGKGNWATYVEYNGVEKVVAFCAGQTEDVGTVTFSAPSGGDVTITINLTGGWTFEDGSVVAVQDYASGPSGNPRPGQFEYKEPASGTSVVIVVPENDYYAVHGNVIE